MGLSRLAEKRETRVPFAALFTDWRAPEGCSASNRRAGRATAKRYPVLREKRMGLDAMQTPNRQQLSLNGYWIST